MPNQDPHLNQPNPPQSNPVTPQTVRIPPIPVPPSTPVPPPVNPAPRPNPVVPQTVRVSPPPITVVRTPQVTPAPPTPPPPVPPMPSSPPPFKPVNLPPAPTMPPPPPAPTNTVVIQKSPFRFLIPVLAGGIAIVLIIFAIHKFTGNNSQTASSTGNGTSPKVTTITYWGLWEPSSTLNDIFTKFEAQNPDIKVNYQQESIKDYRARLQNALQSGTGPDIFRFHLTWTPLFSNDLTPIPSTVLSSKDFENEEYPVVQSWLRSSKGYLGLPLMYEGLGLFYNQAIFEAAGMTPPKTWVELRQDAIDLTVPGKQGGIQRAGVALGNTTNVDNWSDILGLMLLQNAANPANPNNQLGQDALTFYTLFTKTDHVWDDTMPSSTVAFATEKVAMIIAPSWRALDVANMNPNLKFGIAPVPQLPDTQVTWASIWAEGVSSHSSQAKQAAAWKLLSFLNQPDTLRDFYTAASKERLFGEMYARSDMADQLKNDPYVGAFISQAPYAKSWYLSSRTFDNGPNDQIIKYYEDAVNALNGDKTADEVLPTAAQGVNQIVLQYHLPVLAATSN